MGLLWCPSIHSSACLPGMNHRKCAVSTSKRVAACLYPTHIRLELGGCVQAAYYSVWYVPYIALQYLHDRMCCMRARLRREFNRNGRSIAGRGDYVITKAGCVMY